MLVLTRKEGQKIMVGDIEIMVVAIDGNKVRIGVEAPTDVPIFREEVDERIKDQLKGRGPTKGSGHDAPSS